MTPHPVWRVHVLQPLKAGKRKHFVHTYRVGAASAKDAVDKVLAELSDRCTHDPDQRVVHVSQFGMSDSVIMDGVFTRTPAEAAALPTICGDD